LNRGLVRRRPSRSGRRDASGTSRPYFSAVRQRAHPREPAREVNGTAVCGKTARTVERGGACRTAMEGYSGTAYRKGQPQLRPSRSLLRCVAVACRGVRNVLTRCRGKPAVRNLGGDDGNVGIIRSPIRAIVLLDQLRKEKALGLPGLWSGRRDLNPRRSPWQGGQGPRDSNELADLEAAKGPERTRKDLRGPARITSLLPHEGGDYLMPQIPSFFWMRKVAATGSRNSKTARPC
jgi:hypothetical protein